MQHTVKLVRDELIKHAFSAALTAVAGLLVWLFTHRPTLTVLEWCLAGSLATVVLLWAGSSAYQRRSFSHYWYPTPRSDYEIESLEISYVVESDSVRYTRKFRVKALRDHLESYVDHYIWTGGNTNLPSGGLGVSKVMHADWRVGIWTYYSVFFTRPLNKGESHDFTVSWQLFNWRNASPFISYSSEEPTKRLTMRLSIPPDCVGNAQAKAETLRGIESIYPISDYDLSFDEDGRLVWEVKPKLYRHYRLRWAWTGEPAVQDELVGLAEEPVQR